MRWDLSWWVLFHLRFYVFIDVKIFYVVNFHEVSFSIVVIPLASILGFYVVEFS